MRNRMILWGLLSIALLVVSFPTAQGGQAPAADKKLPEERGTYLASSDGFVRLYPAMLGMDISGMESSLYTLGIKKMKLKSTVGGFRAKARVSIPRPSLILVLSAGTSYTAPEDINDFYLSALKQNPKWERRELEAGAFGAWSMRIGLQKKGAIPAEVNEIAPRTFRITALADLAPGEYCIFKICPNTRRARDRRTFRFWDRRQNLKKEPFELGGGEKKVLWKSKWTRFRNLQK